MSATPQPTAEQYARAINDTADEFREDKWRMWVIHCLWERLEQIIRDDAGITKDDDQCPPPKSKPPASQWE